MQCLRQSERFFIIFSVYLVKEVGGPGRLPEKNWRVPSGIMWHQEGIGSVVVMALDLQLAGRNSSLHSLFSVLD